MTRVRFLQDVELNGVFDICCFSGHSDRRKQKFAKGELLEVDEVVRGEKVKARGGAYYQCDLILLGQGGTLHPDRYYDVPSNVFVEEKADEE